jgi:hypothetical protein
MKPDGKPATALLLCALAASSAWADEKEDLLKLRNTTLNLIDMLVDQGVLDKQKAQKLIQQAEQKAAQEAKAEAAKSKAAEPEARVVGGKPGEGPVRVTYVPDFVKEEIRQEVRKELKDDVVKEVKAHAKEEKWGVPAALPDWVNRFKWYGDFRVRYENDFFSGDNRLNTYPDWPRINRAGGFARIDNPFRNTTDDRQRYRIRLRFGLESQIADNLKAVVRLTTSNDRSPISINQSLGQTGQQYEIALDRAFLQYDFIAGSQGKETNWFTVWAGRVPNLWLSTDNVFDPDLNFEGFAGTFRLPFGDGKRLSKPLSVPNTAGWQQFQSGFTQPNEVYLSLGGFPLQEMGFQAHGKWLWAAQTGFDWAFAEHSRLRLGLAYYDYKNIAARPNTLDSKANDWTAPQFFTQGNSLAQISNDSDPNLRLVGLASDFNIIDAVASYDYTGLGQHVIFTADYSENIGFNRADILRRTGLDLTQRNKAFQLRLDIGEPNIQKAGDWNVWLAYKYLQRDAVLDAFTDSNFHLSGTDARGWILGANYGLLKNTWLNARWLSSDVIDGLRDAKNRRIPYSVDVLLVDLNARF